MPNVSKTYVVVCVVAVEQSGIAVEQSGMLPIDRRCSPVGQGWQQQPKVISALMGRLR